jgi:hypothetical protein
MKTMHFEDAGMPKFYQPLFLAQETPNRSVPGQGKARLVKLDQQQKDELSSMASPSDMESSERKRQYAAMGRAIHKTLNPALLAKYQLCNDTERFGV